jgi:hypothetical protein
MILFQKQFGEEIILFSEIKKNIQDCALLLYPDRNPNPFKPIRCPEKLTRSDEKLQIRMSENRKFKIASNDLKFTKSNPIYPPESPVC